MKWISDLPISYLPLEISEVFSNEAKYLLRDLKENKLIVELVPAPDPKHIDHKIRVVTNSNPEWYRELFHSYHHIKRKRVISALERISNGIDRPFKIYPFLYDARMREIIAKKIYLEEDYLSAVKSLKDSLPELNLLNPKYLFENCSIETVYPKSDRLIVPF
jgi:hypothetical protein